MDAKVDKIDGRFLELARRCVVIANSKVLRLIVSGICTIVLAR